MFEKPRTRPGYKCVDMHFHTIHSDGAATIDQILRKIRKLNIGVAITDHNEISGVIEAFKKKNKSDFIIPAVEVNSKENLDLLFYFYELNELKEFFNKEIVPNRRKVFHKYYSIIPLKNLILLSKKYNCVTSVAHPFGYIMRKGNKNIFNKYEGQLAKLDLFEAINGGNARKLNIKAADYINSNNKGFTGGSDGHSIYRLGSVLTCSKAETVKDFLDNIKKKKNYVIGQEAKHGKWSEYYYFGLNILKNIVKK